MAQQEYFISNGLKTAYIYELMEDGTYGEAIELAELIEFSMTINTNSVSMYSANKLLLTDTGLGELPITVTIPSLSKEKQCLLYGHKMSEDGRMIKTSEDVAPYFGLQVGMTVKSNKTGKEFVEVLEMPKVQFQLGSVSGKTKEGTPQLNSVQISANAMPLDNGIYQMVGSTANPDYVDNYGTAFTVPEVGATEKITAYFGGLTPTNRDNIISGSATLNNATLTSGFDKKEGASPLSVQVASTKVNGKLVAFVTSKRVRKVIDATGLDITSDYTTNQITVEGTQMFLTVETGSSVNGNFSIDFKLMF